jgi:DNA mismatch repair ATPase MutS
MTRKDLEDLYRGETDKYNILHQSAQGQIRILSLSRLAVFVAGIAVSIFLFGKGVLPGILSMVFFITIFVLVIIRFSKAEWTARYYSNMSGINSKELASLNGDTSLFNGGEELINPQHDFSHDIDLFGQKSLFQYLNRTCTVKGNDILAGWLNDPLSVAGAYRKRAEAVKELSNDTGWRQRFIALGEMDRLSRSDLDRLNKWLSEKPVLLGNSILKFFVFFMPALTCVSLLLSVFSIVPSEITIILFLLNLSLLSFNLKKINSLHSLVSKQHGSLQTINSLLQHFTSRSFVSPYLGDIKEKLLSQESSSIMSIKQLTDITQAFDLRLNMVLGVILNGLLLWDYHSVLRLEKWKRAMKDRIPEWFNCLGTVDALVSLANYSFNNPEYCFPELSEGEIFLEAEDMGHPLIKHNEMVPNDFSISREGEIVIITGANMAGKSTFLRTVAVNLLMAMIGAPVCAKSFRFKSVNIFTSMRTSDSLSDNESYFYAELKRLKILKERIESGEELLFILDEILKGTNSKDKSEGSRLFIEKILSFGATGIVATHDIGLGELEKKYPGNVTNLCFEVEISGGDISFDYKLQKGITTRMNAEILMRQNGIID